MEICQADALEEVERRVFVSFGRLGAVIAGTTGRDVIDMHTRLKGFSLDATSLIGLIHYWHARPRNFSLLKTALGSLMSGLPGFYNGWTDGWTDEPTDGQADGRINGPTLS